MKKFEVTATMPVFITVTVEADDKDDAIEKAFEFFSLTGYVGNGGMGDKLIGVSDSNVSIVPGEEVIEDSNYTIDVYEVEGGA